MPIADSSPLDDSSASCNQNCFSCKWYTSMWRKWKQNSFLSFIFPLHSKPRSALPNPEKKSLSAMKIKVVNTSKKNNNNRDDPIRQKSPCPCRALHCKRSGGRKIKNQLTELMIFLCSKEVGKNSFSVWLMNFLKMTSRVLILIQSVQLLLFKNFFNIIFLVPNKIFRLDVSKASRHLFDPLIRIASFVLLAPVSMQDSYWSSTNFLHSDWLKEHFDLASIRLADNFDRWVSPLANSFDRPLLPSQTNLSVLF